VAEQDLEVAQVRAVAHELGGERVAEDVGRHPLLDSGSGCDFLTSPLDGRRRDGASPIFSGEHPDLGSILRPTVSQVLEQARREHDVAIFHALALAYMDEHSLAVDVRRLEMGDFGESQPGGIHGHEDCSVLEVRRFFEERGRFRERQRIRGFCWAAWSTCGTCWGEEYRGFLCRTQRERPVSGSVIAVPNVVRL